MSTIKKFAGQTIIYGVSTIVARLLNFILTPIFTGAYPAGIFTTFTNLYSWAALMNNILAFGMETTFFRYLNKHEGEKEKIYSNSFICVAALSILFLFSTIFFTRDIALFLDLGGDIGDHTRYVQYFIWLIFADALAVIPFARLRSEGRPFRYSSIKLANVTMVVVLNLTFIYFIPFLIEHHLPGAGFCSSWYRPHWVGYVFISNLIASVATLLLLLPEIICLKLAFSWSLAEKMIVYSFPVLVANLSFIVNETSDKIMMPWLLPPPKLADVGIYGACAKISIFLSIFITAFRLGAEPFFFSHAKNKHSGQTYSRIMDYFVIAVCLIYVGIVTNIQILKHFIHNSDPKEQALYWSALPVVPILLFGYVSLGIYQNLSIWYKLSDQTRYALYISVTGAVLTIILNVIFIPQYSYMAAAWVTLVAYATMMILSYILGQKNYPIPYNLKKNLLYLVSSGIIAFVSFVIFKRSLIAGNILLVIYMAVIWFVEKDELKKLWKTI